MMFSDPKVEAVYRQYAARAEADGQKMAVLGREGFARRDEFLLPVGEDVGRLLHTLILAHRPRRILELGTSYGYSTLFLADAARAVGGQVITMELADFKQAHAAEQMAAAGLADQVEFRCGDAVAMIEADDGPFDFVLLDIWKELYLPCFEALYPKLSEEGIIAADNMIDPPDHREDVREYRVGVRAKGNLQQVLLPFGQGIELAVKWSAGNAKL
jgi:predicted O-methyltransferase YrrM